MDKLSNGLAVWGAVLSTGLAILEILEYRLKLLRQLQLSSSTDPAGGVLTIEVVNTGPRPVTVREVCLVYGATAHSGHVVHSASERLPQKLEESDAWVYSVEKGALVEEVTTRGIVQREYQRLWVVVRSTSGRVLATPVRIPETIIPRKYYLPAGQWIAADVFLGFPQTDSKIERPPIGVLVK